MTREGYETYVLYLALQRHFSTDYDFFQYNGKVRASSEAYKKRSDVFSFEKLAKIIALKDRTDFFVAHFLENPKEWIKNMSKDKLVEYKARFKNLPKRFKEDIEFIKTTGPSEVMQIDGDIPKIHKYVMNGDILLETIILIDTFFPFIEKHRKEVSIPFIWPDHIRKIDKYKPFVIKKVGEDLYKYTDIARSVLIN